MPESPATLARSLDIEGNRAAVKYGWVEMMLRVLWTPGKVVFRLIPRPLFSARNLILRLFGATIGRRVHIYPSATIYFPWCLTIGDHSSIGEHVYVYNLGRVAIGARATISHRAHLCAGTHNYADPALPLIRSSIDIEDDAWICADAFVGPGVKIGRGAVVGARAVAVRDVDNWSIVAGNPARHLKFRQLERTPPAR